MCIPSGVYSKMRQRVRGQQAAATSALPWQAGFTLRATLVQGLLGGWTCPVPPSPRLRLGNVAA